MAIFGNNKKGTKKKAEASAPAAPAAKAPRVSKTALLSPRITEKGTLLMEQGAYVFNVAKDANKRDIARAIEASFKVMPRQIRVARVPGKKVISRTTNRSGRTASGKKAYVFLKKGDKIEII